MPSSILKTSREFPESLKTEEPDQHPGMERFEELAKLRDEAALRNGGSLFSARFHKEIQSLNRHRKDFPDKNPVLLFRALELKMFWVFRHELPVPELSRASPILRQIIITSPFHDPDRPA